VRSAAIRRAPCFAGTPHDLSLSSTRKQVSLGANACNEHVAACLDAHRVPQVSVQEQNDGRGRGSLADSYEIGLRVCEVARQQGNTYPRNSGL